MEMQPKPIIQMPKYKCHKEVWALKIEILLTSPAGAVVIIPEKKEYSPIEVDKEFMDRHKPKAGGYYVVYADGYESYSPAGPFESGYTLNEEHQANGSKPQ